MDVRERLVKAMADDESGLEVHRLLDELVELEAWDELVQVTPLARADREFRFAGRIVQSRLILGPPQVAALALNRPFLTTSPARRSSRWPAPPTRGRSCLRISAIPQ